MMIGNGFDCLVIYLFRIHTVASAVLRDDVTSFVLLESAEAASITSSTYKVDAKRLESMASNMGAKDWYGLELLQQRRSVRAVSW